MAKFKKVFISLLILLIIAYLGISFYIANQMTQRVAPKLEISPTSISKQFEDASFKDKDGLTLKGWFFPSNSNKLVIMVSGVLNNRVNLGYQAPTIAQELIAKGYNILMYDHRASGQSEGSRVSYGQKEAYGVTGAVNWAKDRGFAAPRIGIIADSMGTSATLGAISAIKDLGPIVLDSPPADMEKVVSHILTSERKVPSFFLPAVYFINRTFFGVDLNKVKPLEQIKLVPERVFLFLHGGKDTSVFPENSQELLTSSNPKSKLVIFPQGKHIETFKTDPNLYRQEVFGFLETGFKGK